MIEVKFSYNLDESKNWKELYALLPLKGSSEEDIKIIISKIISIKNKNIPYREFSYKIESRKDVY